MPSRYRYIVTDMLSGQTVYSELPVIVQSCSLQLNGIGSLSGVLQRSSFVTAAQWLDQLAAIEPFKSVFWVLQDDQPVWAGPITSWSPTTVVGAQVPFQAATMETMFQYRLITETFTYINQDVAAIMRQLASYAMEKTPNGGISGLSLTGNHINVNATFNTDGTLLQSVYDAWTTMLQTYDFEFTIAPTWLNTNLLGLNMRIGAPLMRPYSQTQLQFIFPSANVLDYAWTRQATTVGNAVYAVGTTGSSSAAQYTSAYPNGYNLTELGENYPLLETTVSMQQPIQGPNDVNNYANTYMKTSSLAGQLTPAITLAPNAFPNLYDIQLGDECYFAATSPIHPSAQNGAPGLIWDGRITGWSLTPPSQGNAESVVINLCPVGTIVGE